MNYGTVHLVGAGPGDPDLISVRGRNLITACDCLVHDHLVHPALLALAPATAVRHDVGKIGHRRHVAQDDINRLLLDCATRHRCVVRLKGGDPFVFGRGGEEALFLTAHGVPWHEVPGISSGIAAPASIGIPVTHRGVATAVAFVTGHRQAGDHQEPDWATLARVDTLVIYMGMHHLAAICTALIGHGRSPATPACAISRGTWDDERSVIATLADLPTAVEKSGLEAPAIVVIGGVVEVGRQLTEGMRHVGP
jgi:uroporphyrin-III C-methyltransferase